MKNDRRMAFRIGLITGGASLVLIFLIALFWFGAEKLFFDADNRQVLTIFVPIWAIGLGFCGYGLSKQFYKTKNKVLNNKIDASEEEKNIYWQNYKNLIFSNALNVSAKIVAITVPIYILAYIDNSQYLGSSLFFIIALPILSAACFVASRYLNSKYEKGLLSQ